MNRQEMLVPRGRQQFGINFVSTPTIGDTVSPTKIEGERVRGLFTWVILCALSATQQSFAQSTGTISTTAPKPKTISTPITASASTDLQNSGSPDKVSKVRLLSEVSISLPQDISLGITPTFETTIRAERQDSKFLNTDLALSKSFKLNNSNTLEPEINGTLPTDADLQREAGYQGSIGIGITLTSRLSLIPRGITLTSYGALTQNFSESERDRSGEPNVGQELTFRLIAKIPLSEMLDLGLDNLVAIDRTTTDRFATNYRFRQSLGLQINKQIRLSVGHSNTRDFLGPDGQTTTVEVFSPRTSTIYIAMKVND